MLKEQKDYLVNLIKEYEDYINKRDFSVVYLNAPTEICGLFTELCYSKGIDPLAKAKAVPPFFVIDVSMPNLRIPSNIEALSGKCFYRSKITRILLPKSIKRIFYNVFEDTKTEFIYEGTIKDWNKILKSKQLVGPSESIIIHCSDGNVKIKSV